MQYIGYDISRKHYQDAMKTVEDILAEKDELFQRTQPGAMVYDKEKVSGGKGTNAFDEYVIGMERKQIAARLEEAKSILQERSEILRIKERDLRESRDVFDKVYVAKYLDKRRIYRIARMINYSERQTKRILKIIANKLKDGTKCHENSDRIPQ